MNSWFSFIRTLIGTCTHIYDVPYLYFEVCEKFTKQYLYSIVFQFYQDAI